VAALENDSVEIVDLQGQKLLKSLRGLDGLREPQGILYLPDCDRVVVANAGSGMCLVLDGESFAPVAKVDVGSDADNLRYDAKHKRVCVAYGNGGLATVDAQSWKVSERIKLTDHPEGFQVDAEARG
jgi:DNA-binding beta-propeller fold protein YncE